MTNGTHVIKAADTHYIDADAFCPLDHTEIRWLAGAGFMINARGTVIMIDPLLVTSREDPRTSEEGLEMVVDFPIRAANVPKLDGIFYTHSDGDHLGIRTAQVLQNLNPLMIGPPPVFEKLVRSSIRHQILRVCRYGEKIAIGDITVEVIKADHPWQLLDPKQYGMPFGYGDVCGYKITTPDGTFLAPGDTRLMEDHLRIAGIDLLFLDVSPCEYHLGVKGAVTLANWMEDAMLVPYHWGTYNAPGSLAHSGDPEVVLSQVKNCESRVRLLAPGEVLRYLEGKEI